MFVFKSLIIIVLLCLSLLNGIFNKISYFLNSLFPSSSFPSDENIILLTVISFPILSQKQYPNSLAAPTKVISSGFVP